jgi:hypothetical protein
MSIELTPENLLIQLEYPVKDATLAQLDRIVKNTKGFDKFAKHIISLKDEIRKYSAVVALSNSKDYLKVKCDSIKPQEVEAFTDILTRWSDKYKVKIERIKGKNTYYIIGHR